jgi:hypothetical protein
LSKKDKKARNKAEAVRANLGNELVNDLQKLVKRAASVGVSIIATTLHEDTDATELPCSQSTGCSIGSVKNIPGGDFSEVGHHLRNIFKALQGCTNQDVARLGRNLEIGLYAMVHVGPEEDGTQDSEPEDPTTAAYEALDKARDAVKAFMLAGLKALVAVTERETLKKVADLAIFSEDKDLKEFGANLNSLLVDDIPEFKPKSKAPEPQAATEIP